MNLGSSESAPRYHARYAADAASRPWRDHYEILDGNGNGERFRQFLHGLQAALLEQHPDPVLIMDNVNFHRMDIVVEEMAVLGLDYHNLPFYSPFFNPIEIFLVSGRATSDNSNQLTRRSFVLQ